MRKHSDESDEEYSERLQVMMEKLSHLSIWKNNEYVKYQETKQYSESRSSVSQVSYTEVVQEEHQEEHQEEQQEEHEEVQQKQQKMYQEEQQMRKSAKLSERQG